jgi:hypothetical protein
MHSSHFAMERELISGMEFCVTYAINGGKEKE